MPRLLSVNVGLPRDVTWNGKTVRTSVWKSPVDGRRMVRRLDIDGDAQADLTGHGGEHRAVFVYQMDAYHYWERFLGRNDFTFGQFGENFTVCSPGTCTRKTSVLSRLLPLAWRRLFTLLTCHKVRPDLAPRTERFCARPCLTLGLAVSCIKRIIHVYTCITHCIRANQKE